MPRSGRKLPHAPSDDEVRAMLTLARGCKLCTVIALAAFAGLRSGEVRALQVRDVDIVGGEILVRRALSEDDSAPPEVRSRARRAARAPARRRSCGGASGQAPRRARRRERARADTEPPARPHRAEGVAASTRVEGALVPLAAALLLFEAGVARRERRGGPAAGRAQRPRHDATLRARRGRRSPRRDREARGQLAGNDGGSPWQPFAVPVVSGSSVGARGFEPPTPWSRTRCATRLRYAPSTSPRLPSMQRRRRYIGLAGQRVNAIRLRSARSVQRNRPIEQDSYLFPRSICDRALHSQRISVKLHCNGSAAGSPPRPDPDSKRRRNSPARFAPDRTIPESTYRPRPRSPAPAWRRDP